MKYTYHMYVCVCACAYMYIFKIIEVSRRICVLILITYGYTYIHTHIQTIKYKSCFKTKTSPPPQPASDDDDDNGVSWSFYLKKLGHPVYSVVHMERVSGWWQYTRIQLDAEIVDQASSLLRWEHNTWKTWVHIEQVKHLLTINKVRLQRWIRKSESSPTHT